MKTGNVSAAGVLITNDLEEVLAFRRAEDATLGLPCGKVECWESAAQTAVRECLEETGYVVELLEHLELATPLIHLSMNIDPYVGYDEVGDCLVAIYRARIIHYVGPTHPEEGRAIWVAPDELLKSLYANFNRNMLNHFKLYQYRLENDLLKAQLKQIDRHCADWKRIAMGRGSMS